MKLYFNPASPNCRKVLVTAVHLGMPLEKKVVDLSTGAQRNPDYLAINPNGMVPALEDGDFVLWESNAIMQYVASKARANTLWPNDERTRADITRWQCWDLAHWIQPIGTFMWENMFKKMLNMGDPDTAELKKAEEKLHRVAGVLNTHLSTRDYLVGKGLTLADISVGTYLMYTQPAKLPLENYAHIKRWFAQIEKLPAWKETAAQG